MHARPAFRSILQGGSHRRRRGMLELAGDSGNTWPARAVGVARPWCSRPELGAMGGVIQKARESENPVGVHACRNPPKKDSAHRCKMRVGRYHHGCFCGLLSFRRVYRAARARPPHAGQGPTADTTMLARRWQQLTRQWQRVGAARAMAEATTGAARRWGG